MAVADWTTRPSYRILQALYFESLYFMKATPDSNFFQQSGEIKQQTRIELAYSLCRQLRLDQLGSHETPAYVAEGSIPPAGHSAQWFRELGLRIWCSYQAMEVFYGYIPSQELGCNTPSPTGWPGV